MKNKQISVWDNLPEGIETWDRKAIAKWAVEQARRCEAEGIELVAEGIDVRFDGDTIIIDIDPQITKEI